MSNPNRRALLAGLAAWQVARAQETTPQPAAPPTQPTAIPPAIPPVATPAVPQATSEPAKPAPAPAVSPPIDKSKAYYLFFEQNIDANTARALRRRLADLIDAGVGQITLVLDSPGGLIEPALVTHSFIRALPAKVDTHAQAIVASAATILFLAGQDRSADRNAHFVFHPSAAPIAGVVTEQQLRERLTAFDTVGDAVSRLYRERTFLPASEIDRFGRETVVYTAEQARSFGIVGAVADLRVPGEGKARIVILD